MFLLLANQLIPDLATLKLKKIDEFIWPHEALNLLISAANNYGLIDIQKTSKQIKELSAKIFPKTLSCPKRNSKLNMKSTDRKGKFKVCSIIIIIINFQTVFKNQGGTEREGKGAKKNGFIIKRTNERTEGGRKEGRNMLAAKQEKTQRNVQRGGRRGKERGREDARKTFLEG